MYRRSPNLAPLPTLLAYAQSLGLERRLGRAKRGLPTLAAFLWLALAWRGSGEGVVADRGFTSCASVAAMLASGVPFILGFDRSKPIRPIYVSSGGERRPPAARMGRSIATWCRSLGTRIVHLSDGAFIRNSRQRGILQATLRPVADVVTTGGWRDAMADERATAAAGDEGVDAARRSSRRGLLQGGAAVGGALAGTYVAPLITP